MKAKDIQIGEHYRTRFGQIVLVLGKRLRAPTWGRRPEGRRDQVYTHGFFSDGVPMDPGHRPTRDLWYHISRADLRSGAESA